MAELSREDVIKAARETARRIGVDTLRREDFVRETGISLHRVYSLFPEEGWRGVLGAAELRVALQNVPISNDDLLTEFHRVVSEIGRIPTWAVFHVHAKVARETVSRRFGGLQGTLTAYRDGLLTKYPDSPILELVQAKSRHAIPVPPSFGVNSITAHGTSWGKIQGPEFGPPLNFRGLRHAPINEPGVVYLCGVIIDFHLNWFTTSARRDQDGRAFV
jgi:hypothetical protein